MLHNPIKSAPDPLSRELDRYYRDQRIAAMYRKLDGETDEAPDTLDVYGETDWPEDWAFRAAPYHGWPL